MPPQFGDILMPPEAYMSQEWTCSDLSRQAGEVLYGTALPARYYLLIEYSDAWEPNALQGSTLSPLAKSSLAAFQQMLPGAKILLIRRRGGNDTAGVRFFAAAADELSPALYEFQLQSFDELAFLDLPGILHNPAEGKPYRRETPLYLVCTHGKRDTCCARIGGPVYDELQRRVGEQAWMSSHVGGHRFAANLLILPHGLLYGRLRPEDIAPLLESHQNGAIDLDHLRGRTCYPEPVQAGEVHLRRATQNHAMHAYYLQEARENQPGRFQMTFGEPGNDNLSHLLSINVETPGARIYPSCRPEELVPVIDYRLAQLEHKKSA